MDGYICYTVYSTPEWSYSITHTQCTKYSGESVVQYNVLYVSTIVGFTVLYSSTTVHIVYFVVRYIPGTVVKYSGVGSILEYSREYFLRIQYNVLQ